MRDPEFMNPIGAPEPLGDSDRIVWGIFVLPTGVAPEPQAVRAEPVGGVVLAGVYACFLV